MHTSTTEQGAATTARDLIPAEAFNGVVATVLGNNPKMTLDVADQVVEEALKFVATCARFPGQGLRPSRIVDEGWHALILHTAVYQRLCQEQGQFVHHVPTGEDDQLPGGPQATLERTLAAIHAAGYTVDVELWEASAECSQCHAGCHDSPKSG